MTHHLGGNYAKKVRNNGENSTQNQVPFEFQKVFIEVSEVFHVDLTQKFWNLLQNEEDNKFLSTG